MMLADVSNFMMFELKDSGEKERLYATEQELAHNNGRKFLHDSQVLLIIKEELRRIFIWKGYQSTVRKKFIASRVAQELQQMLITSANFHRCKIVSIDQGEEPLEFLDAFGLQAQKIPKKPEVNPSQFSVQKIQNKEVLISSPNLQKREFQIQKRKTVVNTSYIKESKVKNLNHTNTKPKKEILSKILQVEPPNGYKRNHILIGNNNLYGIVIKKSELFGKPIEESEWEIFEQLPKNILELDGHKLRIHINDEINNITAIEILERVSSVEKEQNFEQETDYTRWTVKQLKTFCSKNKIKVPSSYRKAQIVSLVKEFNQCYD